MSRAAHRLLAIESPFPDAHCLLRLLEPPDSCAQSIWTQVCEGTYTKPFIVDSGLRRSLHFGFDGVQSCMDLLDPDRLTLAYTRRMMAFLLFKHTPNRILLLGLGGGSLAKFCYRHLPESAVTAVEINTDVIALREEFRIPADDERFQIVHADGARYLAQPRIGKDVILLDAYDRSGMAAALGTIEFYENAHRCLTPGGILVTNVCGDSGARDAHILKLRVIFGDQFLTLPVRPQGNVIVFAFKHGCGAIAYEDLAGRARYLERRLKLNFSRYVRRLAQDLQLRRWEPATPALDGLRSEPPLA